jgi:hypothetical protein
MKLQEEILIGNLTIDEINRLLEQKGFARKLKGKSSLRSA